ncbi:BACON domain-containing protein [Streptomyces mangrovisoli]|uniref:BACON domain-containing protein n=1 Tax=Streptomyces mangrovisoli TaxID=1428628 RepID=UPI001F0B2096|nr:hypothetical protein [Streptomyces mangrovisoli]
MMSSSPETSTRTTGAHRAHREARDAATAHARAQRPPARYEPYLDGLFTYCMSVLCDHDAATAALADVLAVAERRGHRGPVGPGRRRAWLYALARWACLRKLAEARQRRQGTHAAGRPDADGTQDGVPAPAPEVQEQRRRELALLAWPEAAGTTPEQREALELAVRHHLDAAEVAAVLGLETPAARELLSSAACEVERTRAALAVVETGACPGVARLTGDPQLVLSAAVRRELVRHVDDCPRCRRTAERAVPGRWPGATVTPDLLPVLEAPRAALCGAPTHHPRARGAAVPRFDRRGFPMDPKDRAARRDRIRARAVTTTVVATVVAAPVLALWAAYRGEPAGDGGDGRAASVGEERGSGAAAGDGYQNAGNAGTPPGGHASGKGARPGVSVEVVSVAGAGKGAERLAVKASNSGTTTLITLTASGPDPVRWSAVTPASWLRLSRTSGTLEPGRSVTIQVQVDPLREPSGAWSARVAVSPAGAVVTIDGHGPVPTPTASRPGGSADPDPTPTAPAASGGTSSASPSSPPPSDPDPTPSTSAGSGSQDPPSPSDDGDGGEEGDEGGGGGGGGGGGNGGGHHGGHDG